MENESTEGRTLTLEVPAALDEWLTERAAALDVDRSELVRQLIGGYQVAAGTADDESVAALETAIEEHSVDVDAVVTEAVEEADADAIVDEEAVVDRVLDRLDDRLDARFERLETEREEKLDDIRRRVVQVKKATESKASADHSHPELERVEELVTEVGRLRERVSELEGTADGHEALASDLEDVQGKLTQLARVVVELRDADEERGGDDERLADIRRTAAREGFETAACGACGETIRVGLLPEPACPHCESQFGDIIDGSGSLFGSAPRLVGTHDGSPSDGASEGSSGADTGVSDPDTGATDVDGPASPDPLGDSSETESDDGGSTVSTDGGNDD